MHVEFKRLSVDLMVKLHFTKGAEPYEETIQEIITDANDHIVQSGNAIMYKKRSFYSEMVTDINKAYEYSRPFISPPNQDIVERLDDFIESLQVFDLDRKRFYAFMRKIVNQCKTVTDIRTLVPEDLHEAITTAQELLNQSNDYLSLSPERIQEFKDQNVDNYSFLNEQLIWDNLL